MEKFASWCIKWHRFDYGSNVSIVIIIIIQWLWSGRDLVSVSEALDTSGRGLPRTSARAAAVSSRLSCSHTLGSVPWSSDTASWVRSRSRRSKRPTKRGKSTKCCTWEATRWKSFGRSRTSWMCCTRRIGPDKSRRKWRNFRPTWYRRSRTVTMAKRDPAPNGRFRELFYIPWRWSPQ